jgi:hypothetical protein
VHLGAQLLQAILGRDEKAAAAISDISTAAENTMRSPRMKGLEISCGK